MAVRVLRVGCLLALCCLGISAPPALADDAAGAKELFRKGQAHFAVGEYEAAAEAYQSAYKLKPDPALLYNAAQAYRLGGNADRALTLYRNYLRFYPDASNVETVRGQIAKLEAERAAATRRPPASLAPPPAAPASVLAPPPPSPDPPAVTATAAPPEPAPPALYRRPWFWAAAGGVAAAVVVVVVVVASSGGGSWNNLPEVRELRAGAVARW
jgi:tetratricopeptide (TPR) repeat protein